MSSIRRLISIATLLSLGSICLFAREGSAEGSIVAVEAADRFADGAASVNAPLCTNPDGFGPKQTAAARAELAYLSGYHFRHVRDGYLTCYHQAAFNEAWRILGEGGAKMLETEFFSYTDDDIRSARKTNPALEAMTAGNEWDVANVDEVLGKDAIAGDASIVTRPLGLAYHMVVGQSYRFTDAQPETFTLEKVVSHDSGSLSEPLRFSHRAGTRIVRVGDFVSDVNDWLAYYAPRFRSESPPFPVLGASLAFTIHSEHFSVPTDRTDGRFGLDAVEEHEYPVPMNANPEGVDGDGGRGYVAINHPPCSVAGTSYSASFNACQAKQQTGKSGVPIWDTEYSYQVVPNGSAPLLGTPHPIPDRIGILYLARSEFFLAAHGRARLYWFQMLDGTDGAKSGFCSYGLIYDRGCGQDSPDAQAKGELLTLGNLISFFSDDRCTYPACTWHPSDVRISWSDPSLPLNSSLFAWKSGKLAIVAWLGVKSYDFTGIDCAKTSACFINAAKREESISSPELTNVRRVSIQTLDVNPDDPTPPRITLKSPDGSVQEIAACPIVPTKAFYGCLTPSEWAPVTEQSIHVTLTDDPIIISIERPQRG